MGSRGNSSSSEDDELSDIDCEGTRRSRSQQLRRLQSLIPNFRQTDDERAILQETRHYLQRMHHDADEIQRELAQRSGNSRSRQNHILGVETEELMEGRFVVKIRWQRGEGVAGHVQRVIECLDVKMTSVVINDENPDEMLSTAFVEVKKGVKMTEEELQDVIIGVARRFALFP